jgi:hypothetical protein
MTIAVPVDKLDDVCVSLKLSSESIKRIKKTVEELRIFEKNRGKLKTDAQLSKELNELKQKIQQVIFALEHISDQNHHHMKWSLGEYGFPGDFLEFNNDVVSPMQQWDIAIVNILRKTVHGIGKAKTSIKVASALRALPIDAVNEAMEAIEAIKANTSVKGGRLAVTAHYATFISNMAFVVCLHDDVKPARGGDFEKLCDVIFEVAGVHSKSEGAIKFFLKKHGDLIRKRIPID